VTASIDVVTGAFGYTGRYIAQRLLDAGRSVRTLTTRPSPADMRIDARPLAFDQPAQLVETLRGAQVLYNTYWVRFPRGAVTYERAVENTRVLFAAAKEAGVERIVHVSITNADERSPLPYFRGKGILERELRESGTSHAIVRPTVVFGREDILVNNIAWILRRLPLFVVPGSGAYRLQPVHVEDLARICVELGASGGDAVVDAVGPEIYTFDELVRLVRGAVGSRARIVHAPPGVAYALGSVIGRAVRDVLVTRDELAGLMDDLLVSGAPPLAETSFREWVQSHRSELGAGYASELARHYRR
jgi:nucleoside-diphosphate-sugar epimerase